MLPDYVLEVYLTTLPAISAGILIYADRVLKLVQNDCLTDAETRGLWSKLLMHGPAYEDRVVFLTRDLVLEDPRSLLR